MMQKAILWDLSGVEKSKDREVSAAGEELAPAAVEAPAASACAVAAAEQIDLDSVSRLKQPEDSIGYLQWQTAHGWK